MQQGKGINPYLKTKVLTASREELRLMLFDGSIKFCRQARQALTEKQFETSYDNMMKAQKIVLELSSSLDHSIMPDVTEKLSALYTYIYRLLIDANMERTLEPIDEAIKLLEFERETWAQLMEKIGQDPSVSKPAQHPTAMAARQSYQPSPGAQQTVMSTYSQSA